MPTIPKLWHTVEQGSPPSSPSRGLSEIGSASPRALDTPNKDLDSVEFSGPGRPSSTRPSPEHVRKDYLTVDARYPRPSHLSPSPDPQGEPVRTVSKGSRLSRRAGEIAHVVAHEVHEVVAKVNPLNCTVMFSGSMLAACAGMTNAVAFLELGNFVSHMTGTLSKVGLNTEVGAMAEVRTSLLLVLSFAVGSAICGCLIARNTVSFGASLYGLALVGNATLLTVAALSAETDVAPYLLAAACGLQNGMATSYSGAVIRTTHVTGLCTDVGLIIGRSFISSFRKHCSRGYVDVEQLDHCADFRKLVLLLLLGTSFLLGVFLGALMQDPMGANALFVPAGLTGTAGLTYSAYRHGYLHKNCLPRMEDLLSPRLDPVVLRPGWAAPQKHEGREVDLDHGIDAVEDAEAQQDGDAFASEGHHEALVAPLPDPAKMGADRIPIERLMDVLDSMEPSLAALPQGPPGMSDLQGEALEAHRRFRSVLGELRRCTEGGAQCIM